MEQPLAQNLKVMVNVHAFWLDDKGRCTRQDHVKNIVTYAGLEKLLKRAAQQTSDDCYVNKAALGDGLATGGGAPAVGDLTLANEVYRNDVISATGDQNVLYLDALFTQEEVEGDFTEFGFYMDGAAGADTGELWNRVAVSWSKTLLESLFVRATFTIVNV
ncbi:MAG TPA: hypothetical protein VIG74_00735 [Alphaproteobacteria bacterium]|jgi:hypothetical protein